MIDDAARRLQSVMCTVVGSKVKIGVANGSIVVHLGDDRDSIYVPLSWGGFPVIKGTEAMP